MGFRDIGQIIKGIWDIFFLVQSVLIQSFLILGEFWWYFVLGTSEA